MLVRTGSLTKLVSLDSLKSLDPSRTSINTTSLHSSVSLGQPQLFPVISFTSLGGAWIYNVSTINVCHTGISHSHMSLTTKPNNKNYVQNNKLKLKYLVNAHRFHSCLPLPRQLRSLLLLHHLQFQLLRCQDPNVMKGNIKFMEEIKNTMMCIQVFWEVAKSRIGISRMALALGVTGNLFRAS